MSVELWWNDTDKGKKKLLETVCSTDCLALKMEAQRFSEHR
jgi:hypothetical protein